MATRKQTATNSALTMTDNAGQVIAQSTNKGKTWRTADPTLAVRSYTRSIGCIINEPTPITERRLVTPMSALHEANIFVGYGNFFDVLDRQAMDAVVISNPGPSVDQLMALKNVAGKIVLDLDAPLVLDKDGLRLLEEALPIIDAVTVPTELIASRLRPYHNHVFVVPHVLRWPLWEQSRRVIKRPTIKVGLPYQTTPAIEAAVAHLTDKFIERVEWVRFDWASLMPEEEPNVYYDLDIVILPPPVERHQTSLAPLLPAMAAQCCIVADRNWSFLKHNYTGVHVGRDSTINWTTAIRGMIYDSHLRIIIGRNARAIAKRQTPFLKINQVALPYRLLIPEHDPVYYIARS